MGDVRVRFPTAPILPYLRTAALLAWDGKVKHHGKKTNHLQDLSIRLSDATGMTVAAEARQLNRVFANPSGTICCHVADRWATALGYHPMHIWDDYEVRMGKRFGVVLT